MAKKQKKPPYSWFRWQIRPRIYDEEQFAPKRSGRKSVSENSREVQGENGEEEWEEIEKEEEQIELEKGDLFAMIISAMITIFPICVGLLLLIVLLAYFLFIH